MGILQRIILAACALVMVPATAVRAGDFRFPPEPIVSVPSAVPIPEYNAWYLRGDVAWAHQADPGLSQAGASFTGEEIDDTWGFGAGFGYNFRENIRGDLTLDYRLGADVTGSDLISGANYSADLSSTVALANLYYDIRGRDEFTPYIGVGIGFAVNETDGMTIVNGGVPTAATGGHIKTELALAAMAGLSFRMRDGWMFDAGYRYLYLGEAETDDSGSAAATLKIEDIQAHEFRFGVRYEFR